MIPNLHVTNLKFTVNRNNGAGKGDLLARGVIRFCLWGAAVKLHWTFRLAQCSKTMPAMTSASIQNVLHWLLYCGKEWSSVFFKFKSVNLLIFLKRNPHKCW